MKNNFQKIIQWFKSHSEEIILTIGVLLISFLSFALGYITAKTELKKPIQIEYENSHNRWRNFWALSCLETFRKR